MVSIVAGFISHERFSARSRTASPRDNFSDPVSDAKSNERPNYLTDHLTHSPGVRGAKYHNLRNADLFQCLIEYFPPIMRHIVGVAAIIVLWFAWPVVQVGVKSPATMLGVIMVLLIVAAIALRERIANGPI